MPPRKPKTSRSKSSKRKPGANTDICKAARLAEMLDMRVRGYGWSAIGEAVNVTAKYARETVDKHLEETAQQTTESARQLEMMRLDKLRLRLEDRLESMRYVDRPGDIDTDPRALGNDCLIRMPTNDPTGNMSEADYWRIRTPRERMILEAERDLLAVHDRVVKLQGLDAAKRLELTGKGGGPVKSLSVTTDFSAMSDEELAEIAEWGADDDEDADEE